MMGRIKRCSILFMLALLFSLFLPAVTSAQVILTQQEVNELGMELAIAKTSIQNSREQLKTAKQRLMELSEDLEQQKKNLIEQKVQLATANKSLELLNKEHKKQIKRISRQRNFAYVISALFVAMAIKK